MHIPSFSRRRRKFEEFHPMMRAAHAKNMAEFERNVKQNAAHLPAKLTNEEKDAKWAEYEKMMNEREGKRRRRGRRK